jgi:RNA polymerase sigma factor (sigma-70 family)
VIVFMRDETPVQPKGWRVTLEPSDADCVLMADGNGYNHAAVPAATVTTRPPARLLRSKRLVALLGDERLVEQIRRGSELAFEVVFERHGAGILAFCRHMLGSHEEAEDAVQHTFAAAFRDLQRPGDEREIALKAWLYTIARNRCVSVLRARRERPTELGELATEGLAEEVERRAELRELLVDLRELPEEQRAALLLAEGGGLSHVEIGRVLGCEAARVKALVFRARNGLIERRVARATPCADIREQLANLRGGALRRSSLRHHLSQCPGCTEYREQVRRQRELLSAALPVLPTLALKANVAAAAGVGAGATGAAGAAAGGALGGGGSAFGGGALGGGAGSALGTTGGSAGAALGAAVGSAGGAFGGAALTKVVLAGALAMGGVAAGDAIVERATGQHAPARVSPAAAAPTGAANTAAPAGGDVAAGVPARTGRSAADARAAGPAGEDSGGRGSEVSAERSHGARGTERRSARAQERAAGPRAKETPRGQEGTGGSKVGQARGGAPPGEARGGGRPEAPKAKPVPPPQALEPKPAPAPKLKAPAAAAPVLPEAAHGGSKPADG